MVCNILYVVACRESTGLSLFESTAYEAMHLFLKLLQSIKKVSAKNRRDHTILYIMLFAIRIY